MNTQGRKTDDQTRKRVQKLFEQGMKRAQIARVVMVDPRTVKSIIRRDR